MGQKRKMGDHLQVLLMVQGQGKILKACVDCTGAFWYKIWLINCGPG